MIARVSGFTFVRNGLLLGYPFRQSIASLLPLVDELVVNVPESEDETLKAVQEIGDDRIVIIRSDWDDSLREGGRILSLQTNRALEACTGDWAFYLQADEVLHHQDYNLINAALRLYNDTEKDSLDFQFLHFEGGFDYVNPFRYRRQVRLIRNNGTIHSVGDACGFARRDGGRLNTADSKARVFHYGWTRPPKLMLEKNRALERLYHDDAYLQKQYADKDEHGYEDIDVCVPYTGTHPLAVRAFIAEAPAGPKPSGKPYFLRTRVWRWLLKKWGLWR